MSTINILPRGSESEQNNRRKLLDLFRDCPIPENEILSNLPLFLIRQDLSNILFINELYQKILKTNGVIMEFGVRWGRNLALYESLRGIYEPFNHTRKIIGFDTFEGFGAIDTKDGADEIIKEGSFNVTEGYEKYLERALDCLEKESPIAHKKKSHIVKGNAIEKIDEYLASHPETIIAFAYFDFDIYSPTKKCLERILSHTTKGTVIAFDELNHPTFPGETLALKEVLGLDRYKIQRSPFATFQSYLIIE